MGELDVYYSHAKNKKSDINEHIDTLREYSSKCNFVCELGTRSCVSTWGILKGLSENKSDRKELIGIDLDRSANISKVESIANKYNIKYNFIRGNDLDTDIQDVDLLFIDTWHVYPQLKRELNKFSPKTRKYIIMHDTTVDGVHGESVRKKMNIKRQSESSGFSEEDIRKGLWQAIEEFLNENNNWKLRERFTNNNGLTVLERII